MAMPVACGNFGVLPPRYEGRTPPVGIRPGVLPEVCRSSGSGLTKLLHLRKNCRLGSRRCFGKVRERDTDKCRSDPPPWRVNRLTEPANGPKHGLHKRTIGIVDAGVQRLPGGDFQIPSTKLTREMGPMPIQAPNRGEPSRAGMRDCLEVSESEIPTQVLRVNYIAKLEKRSIHPR